MKICIPSKDHRGLSSEVFDHFGSAPWFTIVDTEEGKVRTIRNPNCHRDEVLAIMSTSCAKQA